MTFRSRISAEEGRLEGLAQRVGTDAQEVLREYRDGRSGFVEPFAKFAPWLTLAAAAGVAGLWLLPEPQPDEAAPASIVELSIGPTDRTGASFVLTEQPPAGATLLGMEDE